MSDILLTPGETSYNRVDPTARPTDVPIEEFDPTPADTAKYYVLETLSGSMISPSGMRIPFVNKMARVEIAELQRYLDGEIKGRTVPHLRHATDEEVENYRMMMNPRAYIHEQVTAQVLNDPAIREQIRLEEEANARARILVDLEASGEEIPEKLRALIQLNEKRPVLPSDWGGKTENQDTAKNALERLRVGGASVNLTPQNTTDIKANSAG